MPRDETLSLRSSEDVVLVRQAVRAAAVELRFSLVDQTKIVTGGQRARPQTPSTTAVGEQVRLQVLQDGGRRGLRLTFEDKGPGITDVERASRTATPRVEAWDWVSAGARRLSSEFSIDSRPGEGTRVTIARWTT
jgi:serine/threonine-protein kinase RsbT